MPEYHERDDLDLYAEWWARWAYDGLAQLYPHAAEVFALSSLPTVADDQVPEDPEQAIWPETQVSL